MMSKLHTLETAEGNERLVELAEILAAGLTRLVMLKSSPILAGSGESSVGFSPQPSGDAPTLSVGVDA